MVVRNAFVGVIHRKMRRFWYMVGSFLEPLFCDRSCFIKDMFVGPSRMFDLLRYRW